MITGRCHCGETVFEIKGELPQALTRCTCTFCSRRGALHAYYEPKQVKVTADAASDRVYRWNSKMVAHHFCGTCGCTTYSDSPDFQMDGTWDGKTRRIAVNARLFDDFDAEDWPHTVIDGRHLW
ncbi:aldehyde-activating protein [Caulobacter sp. D4A]|uniref:GFA family protein n=1 Tax=Caulobacter sp. D4A TaxID=2204171 RepID=UPI000D7268B6|nr:GFA family protein [Caulobacter sp. D4A]PXA90622.1 aldehyde-activating protein [Caulobacter sp. D4A]